MLSTLPLVAAVMASGVYSSSSVEHALVISATRLLNRTQYVESLEFDDKAFFFLFFFFPSMTIVFLIQGDGEITPRSQPELDVDERELLFESRHGQKMFRSHATILLQARGSGDSALKGSMRNGAKNGNSAFKKECLDSISDYR